MNKLLLGLVGCASLFVGCANEIIVEQPDQSPTSGSGAGTGSSGTGSSGTSGGTMPVCTPKDDGGVFMEPTCKDLDRLVLVSPFVSDDTDGNGLVEAGETASVTVTMKDISGFGFNWYPGVEFTATNPSMSLDATNWFYAILSCTELLSTAGMKVAADVPPGTIVTIHAQIAMLNQKCPDTFAVDIPVTIH